MSTATRTDRCVGPDHDRIRAEVGLDSLVGTSTRHDVLRAAIAQRGGVIDWTVDHTGWVVTLYLPVEGIFSGATLEDGLTACLSWLVSSASCAEIAAG